MNVLLLFEYASLNGGEHSMLCIAPLLQQQGVQFQAIGHGSGPLADALSTLDIELIPLATHDQQGVRLPQDELRAQLAVAFERVAPDLIHANSLSMARLAGPVAAELGLPGIGHLRDILRLSKRAIADINQNRKLVAVSHATRDWHVAQGLAAERVEVTYNGVDLDRFQPRVAEDDLRAQLGLPGNAKLVAAVGQLGMRKGLDCLLDAVSQTDVASHELHLILAGERHSTKQEAIDFEQQLHATANAPPLAGRVHFVGRFGNMPEFYAEIDMLVHAARQEPLGRVLLEAAACAVPIVATRVGGTEEIFPPGSDSAWLVPPDDPAAMTSAIEAVLADPITTMARAKRGRKIIEQRFASEVAARRMLSIYESVLG